MLDPGFTRPDLCSIRTAAEQEELAEAARLRGRPAHGETGITARLEPATIDGPVYGIPGRGFCGRGSGCTSACVKRTHECGDRGSATRLLSGTAVNLGRRLVVAEQPPAAGGFVKEPFSFAVVIWTVHSVLSCHIAGRPSSRPEGLVLNERRPADSGSVCAVCAGPGSRPGRRSVAGPRAGCRCGSSAVLA